MTYDYLCTSCGHTWEAEQRISEDPLKECPACSELAAKRQISGGSGFILKGGGWYSDLYSSSKPTNSADKKSDKSSAKSSEAPATCQSGACGTSACPAASSSTAS
ncbi:MAG TPA: zinc ribbon domain-containing protein [Polyangiaceae bacterium]